MARPFISNVEYVVLRLARRFLFPVALPRIGRYLPFYRVNLAEVGPEQICRLYVDWLRYVGRSVSGRRIVVLGSGATNGEGYALACAGATRVWCVEPYVAVNRSMDDALLLRISRLHNRDPKKIAAAITRCTALDSIGLGNADIIVSHSVLEHVSDLTTLFTDMKAILAAGGEMLHVVDYRDHFFKYPLHFLQFSTLNWTRFLNPGDLPRWRLSDHQVALKRAGFDVRVLHKEEDPSEFAKVRPHISTDFNLEDPNLGVLRAVLYCE